MPRKEENNHLSYELARVHIISTVSLNLNQKFKRQM